MKKFRIIECLISNEGTVTRKTHKTGLSQVRARDLSDKLNASQDLSDSTKDLKSYLVEAERS